MYIHMNFIGIYHVYKYICTIYVIGCNPWYVSLSLYMYFFYSFIFDISTGFFTGTGIVTGNASVQIPPPVHVPPKVLLWRG